MTLQSTDRAPLTARIGAARIGAFRIGFVPRDTQGLTPGSAGGFYVWTDVDPPAITWTTVTEP